MLALVATVALVLSAPTQESAALPWHWTNFDTGSGLPSDQVQRVVETASGTAWAWTDAGLARFDDFRWHPVTADDGLPPGEPICLAPHPDGRVLVVLASRLYVGDENGFHHVVVAADRTGPAVREASVLPDGRIVVRCVGDPNRQLRIIDGGTVAWVDVPESMPDDIDPNPILWPTAAGGILVNTDAGLYFWNGGDHWDERVRANGVTLVLNAACEDQTGRGAAAVRFPSTREGLWFWEAGQPAVLQHREPPHIVLDMGFRSGGLTVGYDNGAVRHLRNGKWRSLTRWNTVHGVLRDLMFLPSGEIWMATSKGVYLHHPAKRRWKSWRGRDPNTGNRVNQILRASDGSMWLGTDDGVVRIEHGEGERVAEIDGRRLGLVTAVAEDADGSIWIGSGSAFEGAYRLRGGKWQLIDGAAGLHARHVHRIVKDRRGRLWFLGMDPHTTLGPAEGPGAFVQDGDGYTCWGIPEGLPSGRMYDLVEAPDGAYWFASAKGLSRFRAGRWTHWSEADGLRVPGVFALALDGDQRLWFAHQHAGLGYLDETDTPRFLTEKDGLTSDEVWGLSVDPRGWLWIASWGGLSLVRDGILTTIASESGLGHLRLWPVLATEDTIHVGTAGAGMFSLLIGDIDTQPPLVTVEKRVVDQGRAFVKWRADGYRGQPQAGVIQTRYQIDDEPWTRWNRNREADLRLVAGEHRLRIEAKGLLGDLSERIVTLTVPAPLYRRPGFLIPIGALTGSVILLGVGLFIRRRRYAHELRNSERRYRELVENAHDLIYTCDLGGRLTSMNRAAEQLLGYSGDDLPELIAIACGESGELLERELERAHRGEPAETYQLRVRANDGRVVELEVVTRRILADGEPVGTQSIARDVTGRNELERRFEEARRMELVGRVAGGVAHDFNNLLTAVLGHADLARQHLPPDSPQRRALTAIELAARRMAELSNQMLSCAGLETFDPKPAHVSEIVAELGMLLRPVVPHDVELVSSLADDLPLARVDSGQLRRVVLNLVTNAIESIEGSGRIEVRVGVEAVTDQTADSDHGSLTPGDHVFVTVADTGCGMDEATRSHIFEPFFSTKFVGRGLGLAGVLGTVTNHRGAIRVDSAVGSGTTVTVLLPANGPVVRRPGRCDPAGPRSSGERRQHASTVLIVDDESMVRNVADAMLSSAGYRVRSAEGGEDALAMLGATPGGFDAVLLDLSMPGMDGHETLQRLRALDPELPVVAMSGFDEKGRPGGQWTGFVKKPFMAAELVQAVDDAVR